MPAVIRLANVYRCESVDFLYQLLRERLKRPSLNISHSKMPTKVSHARFMRSKPYRAWYLIKVADMSVGQIWLNRQNEIGVTISKNERHKGYEAAALRALISKHKPLPRIPSKRSARFLANISPQNRALVQIFKKLGARKIQCTYTFD